MSGVCAHSVTRNNKHHYNVDMGGDQSKNSTVLLADAARVTRNERQIMVDDEFPEEYLLTVYPFTRDVSVAIMAPK